FFILECPPVKEGAMVIVKTYFPVNHSLFKNGKSALFFYRNKILIGNCELNSGNICQNEHNDPNIKLTQFSTAGQYISTLTSSTNTSWRKTSSSTLSGETWTVRLGRTEINETCDIQVYAIFDKPECFPNISMEHFILTCFLRKVFPKALCVFHITLNNIYFLNGSVAYNHITTDGGDYYETSCTFSSPTIENEIHQVTVTMYPNITGTVSDRKYGKSFTFFFPGNF
ncbi:polymorphic transmembrane cluster 2 transmembrane protein 11, partial [Biomphalaria glabrata]